MTKLGADAVALRCLPLVPIFYDIAASSKLQVYPGDNRDELVGLCRKDKRKAISGRIDECLKEADAILANPPVQSASTVDEADKSIKKLKLKVKPTVAPAAAAPAGGHASRAPTGVPEAAASDAVGAGAAGVDNLEQRPERRMTKVRMKLLGIKPPEESEPSAAAIGSTGPGAGSFAHSGPAPDGSAGDDDMVITKARKAVHDEGHGKKKDKRAREHGREKHKEKEKKDVHAALPAGVKRRTAVVDSDDENEGMGAGVVARAGAEMNSGGAAPDSSDEEVLKPNLKKKRKRDEEMEFGEARKKGEVQAPPANTNDDEEKVEKPVQAKKKAKSMLSGFYGDVVEEAEPAQEEEEEEEEDRPRLPFGVPQPPVPLPVESDMLAAKNLRAALLASTAAGDVTGLLKSLDAGARLTVSMELLTESKLTEALKPLRTFGQAAVSSDVASAVSVSLPSGMNEDDVESVRDMARALMGKFKADVGALGEWRKMHKEKLEVWEAAQLSKKKQAAQTAKMQEGKRRKKEERSRALDEPTDAPEQQQQSAATAASGTMMTDLETSAEPDDESMAGMADGEREREEAQSAKINAPPAVATPALAVPAPKPAPAPVLTGAHLLGLAMPKASILATPSDAAKAAQSPAGSALEKDLALPRPTDLVRAAAVSLLTTFLLQAATNTRDGDKDAGTHKDAPLSYGPPDTSVDRVCTRAAIVLEHRLNAALSSTSAAAALLPKEPLASMRAVLLHLDRTADAHPRPDARALALPLATGSQSTGGAGAGTVSASRKLLALLADSVPRLRAAASKAPVPQPDSFALTSVEREAFAPLVPLMQTVLKASFDPRQQ